MGARDDYPLLANIGHCDDERCSEECRGALDEIDRLRRRMLAYERWRDSMSVAMSNLGLAVADLTPGG